MRPRSTRWTRQYPDHGIGLRTGALVGIDIDMLDPDVAHQIDELVRSRLGDTLMRVGRWPKRLLALPHGAAVPEDVGPVASRSSAPASSSSPSASIRTRRGPTHWPLGETPLEVAFEDLPLVDAAACEQLLAEASALLPPPSGTRLEPTPSGSGRCAASLRSGTPTAASPTVVTAGSPGSRSMRSATPSRVASRWSRRHLRRRSGSGSPPPATCRGRARAAPRPTLTPTRRGRWPTSCASWLRAGLPSREPPAVEAEYRAPTLSAGEARQELDRLLRNACGDIEAWHADPDDRESPCIGIRATVGLGKSLLARRHLTLLRDRLIAAGAPSRIAVFAPSHALAEEVAAGWRARRHAGRGPARIRGATSGAA